MEFIVTPIAFVRNSRKDAVDDNWGAILSEIHLADGISAETLSGLSDFSHLEIVYVFHKVSPESIVYTAAHPRENINYPKVGIFAQRKKNRPNRIGLTTVELLNVDEKKLIVNNLDAVDGTPVIDIKPVMSEFLPKGEIKQPEWSKELMKNYWS